MSERRNKGDCSASQMWPHASQQSSPRNMSSRSIRRVPHHPHRRSRRSRLNYFFRCAPNRKRAGAAVCRALSPHTQKRLLWGPAPFFLRKRVWGCFATSQRRYGVLTRRCCVRASWRSVFLLVSIHGRHRQLRSVCAVLLVHYFLLLFSKCTNSPK